MARLRQMTQQHHEDLELALRLDQMKTDRADYTQLIQRFFALYSLLEQGAENMLGLRAWHKDMLRVGLRWSEREKLPMLAADLAALGSPPEKPITRCIEPLRLDNFAAVLGCIYVLEGSTLGGQVITRRLGDQLGLTPTTGLAFFNGYGTKTGAMWRQTRAVLGTELADPASLDAAVLAAQQTFHLFHDWLAP